MSNKKTALIAMGLAGALSLSACGHYQHAQEKMTAKPAASASANPKEGSCASGSCGNGTCAAGKCGNMDSKVLNPHSEDQD